MSGYIDVLQEGLAEQQEQLATLQAKLSRVKKTAANRLIGLCKCGEERKALQAKVAELEEQLDLQIRSSLGGWRDG